MSAQIIALAGFRKVGKSKVADYLCEKHGYVKVHPFGIWKIGLSAMLQALGKTEEEAIRMVDGDLKDQDDDLFPGSGNIRRMRYVMEKLGKYVGTSKDFGSDYTLGWSIRAAQIKYPNKTLLLESVVYEAETARAMGAHIIKVVRPGTEGTGLETDEATRQITPDSILINDTDSFEQLYIDTEAHLMENGLLAVPESCEV